jgi:hypothetical protein
MLKGKIASLLQDRPWAWVCEYCGCSFSCPFACDTHEDTEHFDEQEDVEDEHMEHLGVVGKCQDKIEKMTVGGWELVERHKSEFQSELQSESEFLSDLDCL